MSDNLAAPHPQRARSSVNEIVDDLQELCSDDAAAGSSPRASIGTCGVHNRSPRQESFLASTCAPLQVQQLRIGEVSSPPAAEEGTFVYAIDDVFTMFDNLVKTTQLSLQDTVDNRQKISDLPLEQLKVFAADLFTVAAAAISALQSSFAGQAFSSPSQRSLGKEGVVAGVASRTNSFFIDVRRPSLQPSSSSNALDPQQLMSNVGVVVTDHVERLVAPDGSKQINRYTVSTTLVTEHMERSR